MIDVPKYISLKSWRLTFDGDIVALLLLACDLADLAGDLGGKRFPLAFKWTFPKLMQLLISLGQTLILQMSARL